MRFLTASERALLVEFADLDAALRAYDGWRSADIEGVRELVPAARTVLVRYDPVLIPRAVLEQALAEAAEGGNAALDGPEVVIPVSYDGEDLAETAMLLGVSADELVARHLAASWRVAFGGFAPGFGYLIGDDPLFDVPRRATPRTRVPAGAVGLAGEFTGVYPRESPGGWQLIGLTDAVMWDADRDPPALLAPGARVRFVRAERPAPPVGTTDGAPAPVVERSRAAAESKRAEIPGGPHHVSTRSARSTTGAGGAGMAEAGVGQAGVAQTGVAGAGIGRPGVAAIGADATEPDARGADAPGSLTVIRPALQLLVQDAGRPGHAALGVPASGPADRTALRAANRAVGNDSGAAALELIGGAMLRYRGPATVVAVTGAVGEWWRLRPDGTEEEILPGVPHALNDGDALDGDVPERGLRTVLAVRGGIATVPVLGSAAADTLSGLGPSPLREGDAVAVGDPRRAPHPVEPTPSPRTLPAPGETVELTVVPGPRDDWFTSEAMALLAAQEWEVTPRSDRIGIRLAGAEPLGRATEGELPSEGMVAGALQVPPDGQPVLFLADHPVTGGYPVIACVADRDLDLAAQLPPGTRIRFRLASGR